MFVYLIMLFCMISFVFADNYEILRMNMPVVLINGKQCKKGDVFSDKSVITWEKGKEQVIKAKNTKTREIVRFYSPDFQNKQASTVKDYFMKVKQMSTRTTGLSLEELSEVLGDKFYLVDSIGIESPIPIDGTFNYTISFIKADERVIKTLPTQGDQFYIVRSLFEPCDAIKDIIVKISLSDNDLKEEYILTDSMRIQILPMFLDD